MRPSCDFCRGKGGVSRVLSHWESCNVTGLLQWDLPQCKVSPGVAT